jgi:hypothetical protein
MQWIDWHIRDVFMDLATRLDPLSRPHQLFLTGDQIYADEIPAPLMDFLNPVANELIGATESIPTSLGAFECNLVNFPPGFRQAMMFEEAGFTTSEGQSHLISFGEFAAMYLMGWSNVIWPDIANLKLSSTLISAVTNAPTKQLFFSGALTDLQASEFANWILGLDADDRKFVARGMKSGEDKIKEFLSDKAPDDIPIYEKMASQFQVQFGKLYKHSKDYNDALHVFYDALPNVRRGLANVPTYMVLDDHEATDDWNVRQEWRDRVSTKPMGNTILRNSIASYVVFQAWGNDPEYFATADADADSLATVSNFFPPNAVGGPSAQLAAEADQLFGLDPLTNDPPLRLHYTVPGPQHVVIGLDPRTRRGYFSSYSSPALLSETALEDEIAEGPLDAGISVAIVLAPAPVLGPHLIESVVWPALVRVWDMLNAVGVKHLRGFEDWDSEAWAFNEEGFEDFLDRLAPKQRIIFLSGDVHYAAAATLDYWWREQGGPTNKARFVQFTSSAVKHAWPGFAQALIRHLSLAQQALRWAYPVERLAWKEGGNQNHIALPPPDPSFPVPPALLGKLRKSPVLIPTRRWPQGTSVVDPPDWSWRMLGVTDERLNEERPVSAQLPELPQGIDDIDPNTREGYNMAAERHMNALHTATYSRRMNFSSNFGLILFEEINNKIAVAQHLYSAHPDEQDGKPLVFALHKASLEPTDDPEPNLP